MAQPKTVQVIVARDLHGAGEGKRGQWRFIGYVNFLEEAYAVVDRMFEKERAERAAGGDAPEQEYDVWTVPDAWSIVEPA